MDATAHNATDNYVVRHRPSFNGRAPWVLFVLLDDGSESRLHGSSTRGKAMTTGRMLAGWKGTCKVLS